MEHEKIYISNIQRFCVHDGPGIRTVVFVVGCPLKCKWCQNPETLSGNCELMFNKELCAACDLCINVCPQKCIDWSDDRKLVTDLSKCDRCFNCVEACPFQARQISCKPYSVDALFKELMKDEIFYKNTKGGITISGGEPMLKPDFCFELLNKIKHKGIHTAIETCGFTRWQNFEKVIPVVDMFLYDIKLFNKDKHIEWTSQDNEIILSNLKGLMELKKEVIIRIPLIPGVNDGEEFKNIVDHISQYNNIGEIHILPFHQLGSSKYEMLGMSYDLESLQEDNGDSVEQCKKYAERKGVKVSIGGSGL